MEAINFTTFQGWVDRMQNDAETWARAQNPDIAHERIMDYGQGIRRGAMDALHALSFHGVLDITHGKV